MAGGVKITKLDPTERFEKDYKKITKKNAELAIEINEALKDLLKDPIPKKRVFEDLEGYKNPKIFTIHITNNCSHKLSFEISGETAILRRVSTHKKIDRSP